MRIVHGTPTMGKNMLSIVFEEALPEISTTTPNNAYHIKERRREEAVAIQLINAERLAISGVCHLRNFRDTFNAYPSITHIRALDPLETINPPKLHDPLCDHIQRNVFCITVDDEHKHFRADCGVFAGSSVGTHFFNIGAWPAQAAWAQERRPLAHHLEIYDPVSNTIVNTSATVFADDAGATVTGATTYSKLRSMTSATTQFSTSNTKLSAYDKIQRKLFDKFVS